MPSTERRPRFREPPLAEAVLEFRFERTGGWDWTVPGRLYERLRDRFPTVEQVAPPTVVVGAPHAGPAPVQAERLRFRSPDGTRIVQCGPWLLSVNVLPPYPGWEELLNLGLGIYRLHRDLVGDLNILRLGLRYINKVDPRGRSEDELMAALPDFRSIFEGRARGFFERFEIEYLDPPGTLTFQTGTMDEPARVLMIDLDFWRTDVGGPDEEALAQWLGRAHATIETVFVRSLTEQARALLGLEFEEVAP